ncbi:MAG TPA: hypothetical protein VMX76_02650 [Nevskiaceae bacterium]|nr:hypothetical protein [Nevskiaceae bacterium]
MLLAPLLQTPIFGEILPPPGVSKWKVGGGKVEGLIPFLNGLIRLLIVGGGIFALLNIILAGYGFLSAGDDPKKIEAAWKKIWQSLLGLLFIAGAFVLAGIFGYLIFGNWGAILNPDITGP